MFQLLLHFVVYRRVRDGLDRWGRATTKRRSSSCIEWLLWRMNEHMVSRSQFRHNWLVCAHFRVESRVSMGKWPFTRESMSGRRRVRRRSGLTAWNLAFSVCLSTMRHAFVSIVERRRNEGKNWNVFLTRKVEGNGTTRVSCHRPVSSERKWNFPSLMPQKNSRGRRGGEVGGRSRRRSFLCVGCNSFRISYGNQVVRPHDQRFVVEQKLSLVRKSMN